MLSIRCILVTIAVSILTLNGFVETTSLRMIKRNELFQGKSDGERNEYVQGNAISVGENPVKGNVQGVGKESAQGKCFSLQMKAFL
ncbi:hypothetical protein AYI69_g7292 [Smittium culicis]|uniref:Uncharacterized protein n=1 Tax=Smittium culicis TaxID=133412 RepID=A0A1R1XT59_9FUNG|nr:hypothetical protein AYI69_g7292 [Smittium culicis]